MSATVEVSDFNFMTELDFQRNTHKDEVEHNDRSKYKGLNPNVACAFSAYNKIIVCTKTSFESVSVFLCGT